MNSNTWRFCGCGLRRQTLPPVAIEAEIAFAVIVVVVVVEAAVLAVLEAVVSTVVLVKMVATMAFSHVSAIYQYDVASLYSLGSMVKKSSSFHCRVSKVGRRIGSLFQHSSIISYRATLQFGGCGIR